MFRSILVGPGLGAGPAALVFHLFEHLLVRMSVKRVACLLLSLCRVVHLRKLIAVIDPHQPVPCHIQWTDAVIGHSKSV